ncbi:MAG: hypothetical protein Q7U74_13150, partial [Saprospiraceae bacterium]|nr:hypothetical protein [Saprospiraceae bacterium]
MVIVAGVGIAGVTFLPRTWQDDTLNVPVRGAAGSFVQPVTFRYPREMLDGEQVLFEMTVPSAEDLPAAAGSPVQLEGRLELAGVDLFPSEMMRVPFRPGQTVSFRWLVTAHQGAAENGTLWLVAIGIDSSIQATRFPLIARPIQLEVREVLGLNFLSARWVGSGMIGVGMISAI